jgi:polysaccharide export outer membrane protein
MKPGSSLVLALLLPAFFCSAQEKPPAVQPAAQSPATQPVQRAAKPAAPDAVLSAVQDAVQAAERDAEKRAAEDAAKSDARDAAKPPMDNSYVIGELDILTVVVWREDGLTDKSTLVRPDGMISLPLVGDIKASGKTPMQLAKEIAEQLKKFVQDPNVTVSLNQMNSKRVYLMGEIAKAGPIMMTPGMTLLEAIGTAGGLTQFANANKMYILRIAGGKQQKIPVEYKQALKGDHSLNLTLISGDTIVVP